MSNQLTRSNILDISISEFFLPPTSNKQPPGVFSTLYLLRRDAAQCMGFDPNTLNQLPPGTPKALWPGVMAVFAGIDLLAKLYVGKDNGSVRERFEGYAENFVVPDHKEWKKPLIYEKT